MSTTATTPTAQDTATSSASTEPFRFYDNREKYLLFVTTTSEKAEVATRIGRELTQLKPTPPALRVFDAGTGNGVVLSHVLRDLHRRLPTVPFVVVGKEISMEDTRLTLAGLPDRLAEHPDTVVVLTNMFYAEAPSLYPRSPANQAKVQWWDVPLEGDYAYDYHQQISGLEHILETGWQTTSSKSGNPVYATPSVLVLYRADRAFALHDIIPRNIGAAAGVRLRPRAGRPAVPLADRRRAEGAHRARAARPRVGAERTARRRAVDRPRPGDGDRAAHLARRRAVRDPRNLLIQELDRQLNGDDGPPAYSFDGMSDALALFTYHLHAMPSEVTNRLSTSTALAAWNAAVYVAQIEDERVTEVMQHGDYLQATKDVVLKHGGLWFQDESFVVVRNDA